MDAELIFKALGDRTRQRIMQMVTQHELSVSELVDCLGQPQSTVSRHLKVLRDAGLIHDRRAGTTVLYATPELGATEDDTQRLRQQVIEWIGSTDLPPVSQRRLDTVLTRRQAETTDFFSRVAHRWDQMRVDAFGQQFHLDALVDLLPNDWVVADIGTGTGYLLPVLSRAFRRVVAVDPSEQMLQAARSRCAAGQHRNVVFRRGDLGHLPISDEAVELALAVLVIHHVSAPADALGELYRVVKPGGRLLIVEQQPHKIEAFHERMQDRWWGFDPDEFTESVRDAGFRSVRVRSFSNADRTADAPDLFTIVAQKPRSPETYPLPQEQGINDRKQVHSVGNEPQQITMETD
jgi:SAM-dependent methyltransferase/DNA-binding transcriptional ArsR family regulator